MSPTTGVMIFSQPKQGIFFQGNPSELAYIGIKFDSPKRGKTPRNQHSARNDPPWKRASIHTIIFLGFKIYKIYSSMLVFVGATGSITGFSTHIFLGSDDPPTTFTSNSTESKSSPNTSKFLVHFQICPLLPSVRHHLRGSMQEKDILWYDILWNKNIDIIIIIWLLQSKCVDNKKSFHCCCCCCCQMVNFRHKTCLLRDHPKKTRSYCGWLKSETTTCDVWTPINNGK